MLRDSFLHDLRYAARGMRLRPAFAALAAGTLALGIAANAIMFGVIDRLLLRPPPGVADPERVVRIYFRERPPSFLPGQDYSTTSVTTYPMVTALAEQVPSLAEVAATHRSTRTIGRGAAAREASVALVSGNFFHLLGVRPLLGRFFAPDEDRPPAGTDVAVVGYAFWRAHFGGERSVLGSELVMGPKRFTVVGVAPDGFAGVDLDRVDLWVPVSTLAAGEFGDDWRTAPHSWWVQVIGRLRPSATPERVSEEATVAFRRAVAEWQQPWRDSSGRAIAGPLVAARGPGDAASDAKVPLWLAGVSAVVLLIACANVANLLLARATERRGEIAVRLALGIGRVRLLRQLLIEAILLALGAAGLALLLAHWGGQLVRGVLLPGVAWEGSPVDGRVLAVTLAVTIVTGLLAGLAPALQSARTNLAGALKAGPREGGGRRSTLRSALLITQAALSMALLVGAGLFVRSLRQVRALDLGVDLERVLLVRADLRHAGISVERARSIYDEAYALSRRLPGVESASLAYGSVPTQQASAMAVRMPGRDSMPELPGGGPYFSVVTPGYFATLGTRLVRGREITEGESASGARVIVVNETIATHFWPGGNPIGQCLIISQDKTCSEVVGVAKDVIVFSMIGDPRGQLYLATGHPMAGARSPLDEYAKAVLVRAAGDPEAVASMLRREIQALAPDMPSVSVLSFEELVAPQRQPWRLGATMFGVFGGLALVIAAVGLYSVVAYGVSRRAHEMGVRMALGARRRDVIRLVLFGGMRVIGVGLVLGVAAAMAAARWLQPLLYGTSARDAATYLTAASVLGAASLLASFLPAWRASRVDPAVALRAE